MDRAERGCSAEELTSETVECGICEATDIAFASASNDSIPAGMKVVDIVVEKANGDTCKLSISGKFTKLCNIWIDCDINLLKSSFLPSGGMRTLFQVFRIPERLSKTLEDYRNIFHPQVSPFNTIQIAISYFPKFCSHFIKFELKLWIAAKTSESDSEISERSAENMMLR